VAAPVARKKVDVDAFCETRGGQQFSLPETEQPAANIAGWTWVNVWATWCKPCVAEMPMIVKWREKLVAAGLDVAIQFLSVDAKADDVSRFQSAHPDIPTGPRIRDVALLSPWLGSIGLDASAVLPVHLFVDPSDTIRCVRMGALAEYDYEAVEALLSGK
jgi:thiol-disulfide isomerase/thioredoxin